MHKAPASAFDNPSRAPLPSPHLHINTSTIPHTNRDVEASHNMPPKRKKTDVAAEEEDAMDWASLTVANLKAELVERGLPVSGNKAALVSRLNAAEGPGKINHAKSFSLRFCHELWFSPGSKLISRSSSRCPSRPQQHDCRTAKSRTL